MTHENGGKIVTYWGKVAASLLSIGALLGALLVGIREVVTKPVMDRMERLEYRVSRIESNVQLLQTGQGLTAEALKHPLWSDARTEALDSLSELRPNRVRGR